MWRKLFFTIALLGATILQAAVYTPAEVPNPKDQGQQNYVADPDRLLADSTVDWLNHCAAMLYDKTHAELCVVALTSIGNSSAFDFAYELFQRWGIGQVNQNTGILVLFVLESHDLRIMTGTGIEGVLTDAKCNQIMHDDMFPAFKQEDYDAGLCLGALSIYETCTQGSAPDELLTIQSVTNRGKYAPEADKKDNTDTWITWISVLIVILLLYWASRKGKNNPNAGKPGGRRPGTTLTDFDDDDDVPYSSGSSWSSSSWGGSSGGGSWGGGSTSGGGAGGKW